MRPTRRPEFLTVERVLGGHGTSDDISGRSRYRNDMKKRVLEILHSKNPKEADDRWQKIRRGWAFGSEEFCLKIQGVLDEVVSGKRRDSFMGEEVRLHDEKEAGDLFEFGLKVCDITEPDLPGLKKGDERKKAIAWLIRKKTSVRVGWITSRLKMGTTSNFARYIRAVEQSEEGALWELKNKMMN